MANFVTSFEKNSLKWIYVLWFGKGSYLSKKFGAALRNSPNQGYRDRYDIIDHGHEKTTFMFFFHRSIFTEIREFANHCFMEVSYKLWL